MESEQRHAYVMKAWLCVNCLARSHQADSCASRQVCRYCGQLHHSMLHRPSREVGVQHEPDVCDASVQTTIDAEQHRTLSDEIQFAIECLRNGHRYPKERDDFEIHAVYALQEALRRLNSGPGGCLRH